MKRIVLVGSGNIASSVGVALTKAGHSIVQVYSATLTHAQQLAGVVGAAVAVSPVHLVTDADFYLLAVPDNAIEQVAQQLPATQTGIVLHTSGSTAMEVLAPHCIRYGVLYPLQTFSKKHIIADFSEIPIFTEACSPAVGEQVTLLARSLSKRVEPMDSVKRRTLHVAAVFSCNFVNHLFAVAFELLRKQDIAVEYLRPLVEETVRKAFESGKPFEVQTGPAVRKDMGTLQKHIDLLEQDPLKKQLYKIMTEQIICYHKNSKE